MDAVGIIDELSFVCTHDLAGQSSMRSLSRAVAAFVADCMQFVAADDVEIVIVDFVSTASLVSGYELLRKIGQEHRSACLRPRGDVDSDVRYMADAKAVKSAVEIWRHRAKRLIGSGDVMNEGDLHLFLDGLARFGVGATDADTLAANTKERQPAWAGPRTG